MAIYTVYLSMNRGIGLSGFSVCCIWSISQFKQLKHLLLSLSQWICCDIRYLDVSILGKFAVVMADPPWDIHMELPYGTLTDDEMRKLNIPILQDDGFLFLWVTGRYKWWQSVDYWIWHECYLNVVVFFYFVSLTYEESLQRCGATSYIINIISNNFLS